MDASSEAICSALSEALEADPSEPVAPAFSLEPVPPEVEGADVVGEEGPPDDPVETNEDGSSADNALARLVSSVATELWSPETCC
jgi:hypothetical protein